MSKSTSSQERGKKIYTRSGWVAVYLQHVAFQNGKPMIYFQREKPIKKVYESRKLKFVRFKITYPHA